MQTLTLRLPKPHAAQREIIDAAARFNVVCCGRRYGKTQLGIDQLLPPALYGYPVAWFAPTYKMMLEVWREVRNVLKPVSAAANTQERRIELITGGVVEMWSLDNPDAGRSRKYKRVIIDEAAMVAHLGEAWQSAIRPTLTDYEGDGWLLSTPKGRNFFWQMYQWGRDPHRDEWRAWQMPTSANPYISKAEIEAARQELPERTFQQEYLAEFLEDGGGVFRNVAALSTLKEAGPQAGLTYVGGIDWARSHDFTVLTIIDTRSGEQVAIDRFTQTDYEVQLGRFRAMHERYNVATWIAEYNSMGGPLVERLQRDGYPVRAFVTTNATKMEAIDALALALEREDITLLNDEVQKGELIAYEAERLPSGRLRYGAPEGMHDDTVIALALAWHGCKRERRTGRQAETLFA